MVDALGGSVIRFMSPFASFLCLLVRVSSYLLPHEDVVVEISEHELVIIVEEFGCLLARVYLKREYATEGRQRFDVILGLFLDCLNIFSTLGHSPAIEISYPGLDMQLLLNYFICANQSQKECEYLIELAKPHMQKSTIVDSVTCWSKDSRVRTSVGMFHRRGQDKIIRTIEKRIADFSFIQMGSIDKVS
ncbi:hypothetical protein ZIOFF_032160 [Zingiber officinale]|uniref:Uncharacterized protein n=1 Tax=Zingiber officinale TaxID=94328 RepID=A0A8J5GMD9_ZINOF|nr:hypothetical protein ZIOFF_032160 [Zingiber officinale]